MKLTKATYRKPDDYGDTNFEVEAVVENKKEDIVDMSVYSLTIVDGNNNTVTCDYEREESSYAEKDETFAINLSSYAKGYLVSDFAKAKAIVDLTTYRKEFKKLGDFDIPADHKSTIQSNNQTEFGEIRVLELVYLDMTHQKMQVMTIVLVLRLRLRIFQMNISKKFLLKLN